MTRKEVFRILLVSMAFLALLWMAIAYGATPTYLWARVPLAIEPDWRDRPADATVSAQVAYFLGDAASPEDAAASLVAMPADVSVTAIPWVRMWTSYDTSARGWADYRAASYPQEIK